MLRTGLICHFDVTLSFATPKSSGWQALMFLSVVGGNARAERTNARPSRAVVARRLRRLDPMSKVVRFLNGIKTEGKRISLVTMAGAFSSLWCKEVIADVTAFLSLNLVDGTWASFPQVDVR
jgi:hypothetical protein